MSPFFRILSDDLIFRRANGVLMPEVQTNLEVKIRRDMDMQQNFKEALKKLNKEPFQVEEDARIAMKEQSSHSKCR